MCSDHRYILIVHAGGALSSTFGAHFSLAGSLAGGLRRRHGLEESAHRRHAGSALGARPIRILIPGLVNRKR